jgi:cell division protein FtsB
MVRRSGIFYLLALLALVGGLVYYVHERDLESLHVQYQQTGQQVEALRKQVENRKIEEKRLQQRARDLQSDPVEMEAAIRQRKNLVRKGETVYRVELADD